MTSRSDYHFGNGLRDYLDSRGVRPSFIAAKMGVSPQMMYQWEHSTDIRLRSAIKIAEALEISLDDLVSICYEK
jgi:transcriptional regulator with XRE-family HTH domain